MPGPCYHFQAPEIGLPRSPAGRPRDPRPSNIRRRAATVKSTDTKRVISRGCTSERYNIREQLAAAAAAGGAALAAGLARTAPSRSENSA